MASGFVVGEPVWMFVTVSVLVNALKEGLANVFINARFKFRAKDVRKTLTTA
jgi:hypothetical protein